MVQSQKETQMKKKTEKKVLTNSESSDWYERNVDEPVRELVKHLRNNGVNTECCCGHDTPMYIQCQYSPDGSIQEIHQLVWTFLAERKQGVNFTISLDHTVRDGYAYSSLNIELPNDDGDHIAYWERMRQYHQERVDRYTADIEREKS